jgi:hypothetical protein
MDLYIAAAVVAVLLAVLVLCWMQPRRKAASKPAGKNQLTLTVELEGADTVSAQIDALSVKAAHLADMLARAKRDAGLIALPVRTQAAEPRKAKPQPKRTR